ncbi:MAG: stringent starvation protein B [Alphaproteobacteria bacterium]|nr:stringent starvation protein B [Alphaproteobacteria bacterium]
MSEYLDEINYDKLINRNLLGVVRDALKIASVQGLPGENHFYITFRTNEKGVELPKMLQIQYPENMTIVLQHQFSDLMVDDDKFSVVLVFGGVPYTLVIPFHAISYFADPYAKFGLSFEMAERVSKLEDMDIQDTSKPNAIPAEVISIDSFRKK